MMCVLKVKSLCSLRSHSSVWDGSRASRPSVFLPAYVWGYFFFLCLPLSSLIVFLFVFSCVCSAFFVGWIFESYPSRRISGSFFRSLCLKFVSALGSVRLLGSWLSDIACTVV